jgi:alpha-L-fucosidase
MRRHPRRLPRRFSRQFYVAALLILCISNAVRAQTFQPTWQSLDKRPVPQWFKDAKFGIFIHWGVYSVPGWSSKGQYAEWYQEGLNSGDTARIQYQKKKFGNLSYYQLADQFKAELYKPDEWAQLIEKSGARYVVLTSKHHDGFANWPSKEASRDWGFPWNAAETGPHRDLLGDLFTAIRKTSVHPGLYYSLYEWYNPLWLKDRSRYVSEHMWPQMKDIVNSYKPEVLWTDGDWDASDSLWKSREFLSWLYNESPVKDKIVTYDRWGSGIRFHHGGVYTPEYQPDADFADHYWEESRGMGFSYGYNREEDSWDYNSAKALVFQLIDKVSRGGNFLLDIGPDEHGKIPPIMQERLLQIGEWMKINGEAIYGSTRWKEPSQWSAGRQDYKPANGGGDLLLKLTVDPEPGYAVKECFFTYNAEHNDLYAILPKWPAVNANGGTTTTGFTIHNLTLAPGTHIQLLETHEDLGWHQQGNDCVIDLPLFDPNKIRSQFAFVIKILNTGAFADRPVIDVSYPKNPLRPVISVGEANSVSWHYTLDGTAPDESSPVYTHPFELEKSATLTVQGFGKGKLPGQLVVLPIHVFNWHPAQKPGKTQTGLQYSAYELNDPSSVKDIDGVTPVRNSTINAISASPLSRKENAGLVFEGYVRVPSNAIYSFYLSSDDGSKLWLDGEAAIDNDGRHGQVEMSAKIPLKAGYHAIRIAYFNASGDGVLQLSYGTGNEKKPVTAGMLYRSGTAE